MQRYATSGNWYKGNLHIHSTASDGGLDFTALACEYARVGYDFLFRTDHWVASNVTTDNGKYPLLWLDGIEIDGVDGAGARYHVVCLGSFSGIYTGMGFPAAMQAARDQNGFRILAHPAWMGNAQEDLFRWRFDGVETYNHVCQWLNGKGDSTVYWNMMLERSPHALGFAVDDAHITSEHPGWNGGWIMVNAPELTCDSILSAIRSGNYYSSCGPEFYAIHYEDDTVTVHTSPVRFIRLVGPAWNGKRHGTFEGRTLTGACFEVPRSWPYAYIEIEDAGGRRAWTNTLMLPE